MSAIVANVGAAAGLTWIVLDVLIVLPQTTVDHVSSTSPPQAPGIAPNVEVTVPLRLQPPLRPLS